MAPRLDQRKRLIAQGFQWGQGAGGYDMHGFCTAFPKFLGSLRVH